MKNKTNLAIAISIILSLLFSVVNATELAELMQGLAKNKYKVSHFREIKHAFYLEEPLLSEGTIEFQAPDLLIKKTTSPFTATQEISSTTIRTVDESGEESILDLSSQPAIAVLFNTIRGVLSGDLSIIEKNYTTIYENKNKKWSLALKPKQDYLKTWFKEIIITGISFNVRSIKIVEANNDTTIMKINDQG